MTAPLFDLATLQQHKQRTHPETTRELLEALDSNALLTDILSDTVRAFPSACLTHFGPYTPSHYLKGHYGIESLYEHNELEIPFTHQINERFDLIISYFHLHWHNDVLQSLKNYYRLLKPNGLFISLFFGGYSLTELRQSLLKAESELTQQAAPRISPTIDVKDAGRLIQLAGFENPVSDLTHMTVSYDHPLTLLKELKQLGETNALLQRTRQFMTRRLLHEACATYSQSFADEDGRVPATIDIITMTGWKPRNST
ncbi:MAG: methyltransferase domain-containing protein [Alphaproteobacteria bacterium]|nr:methyltransferase domain-containing protein [Alphaproteobacteria bacterium]